MTGKEKDNIINIADQSKRQKHKKDHKHNEEIDVQFFSVKDTTRAVMVRVVCTDCGKETFSNIFSDGSCQGESFAEIMGFRNSEEDYIGDDCGDCDLCNEIISNAIDCENTNCDECGLCAESEN